MGKLKSFIPWLLLIVSLSACSAPRNSKIDLVDAKTAKGIDEMYRPVDVTNVFPQGTSRVFCWFKWKNAEKGINLMSRWDYVTDGIPIMRYVFVVSRREGQGSVSLVMPPGKILPSGTYRVTLELDKKDLKSLTFKVLETP